MAEATALTVAAMVSEARRRVKSLRPAEVAVELNEDVVLVDIREEDELH